MIQKLKKHPNVMTTLKKLTTLEAFINTVTPQGGGGLAFCDTM